MPGDSSRTVAVLGPTNTGKTRYALERMLAHRTGVFGLPLRLLAREIYDKAVKARGPSVVALVTGEERIVPPRARYWIATAEAMPSNTGAEFMAVDEIQLCADPERGHVFTDRLLGARGLKETLFLGSTTMRQAISELVPNAKFLYRERYSSLTYSGQRKISRMRPRSAIVGFSVDEIYAIAEMVRIRRGGAAVVMGALSPRTRNAQVAMYQNGDVDYLVATDAIGMGLNLDIDHVAFAGLSKFDGRRTRRLQPNELAQIAGRAGRYRSDGTFGVTGTAPLLEREVASAIEDSRFARVRQLQWRNTDLELGSVGKLIASLEAPPGHHVLVRTREADDLRTLKMIAVMPELEDVAPDEAEVQLLWDVCQVPDFRQVSIQDHVSLVISIFTLLRSGGCIPADWLATRVAQVDRADGDIDSLAKRLAFIRTWKYVVQRTGWVADEVYWRERTREVEDRISDALHRALTRRFVDRRTSVLMRRLQQKDDLMAEIGSDGGVTVEGEYVGRLDGFRFEIDSAATSETAATLRSAARRALKPEFSRRADALYNSPDQAFDVSGQGEIAWQDAVVGRVVKGDNLLAPEVRELVDDDAGEQVAERVRRRLAHFAASTFSSVFAPLIALRDDETVVGLARGVAHRLVESLGVVPRSELFNEVREMDQEQRKLLRKHGVRFGQRTVFMFSMLKPAPTRLRVLMWALRNWSGEIPESPPPGRVSIPAEEGLPNSFYVSAGFRVDGKWAVRVDMWERLMDLLRQEDSALGFEASADMLSITGMTHAAFAELMEGMGYEVDRCVRKKAPNLPEATATATASGSVKDAAVADGDGVAPAVGAAAGTETQIPDPDAGDDEETYFVFRRVHKKPARVRQRKTAGGQGKTKGRPRGNEGSETALKTRKRNHPAERHEVHSGPFSVLAVLKQGQEERGN